jgi:hypothetical protein
VRATDFLRKSAIRWRVMLMLAGKGKLSRSGCAVDNKRV